MVAIPSRPNVAKPPIDDLDETWDKYGMSEAQYLKVKGSCFTNRYDPSSRITGKPEFIVLHTQDGNTAGSLQYWGQPGIQASAQIMANRDGTLVRVIADRDGPWTNGDVIRPTPEANEIIAKGGNPNIWSLTIEREDNGDPSLPPTKAQADAVLWQMETWTIAYPRILSHHYSILRHRYINSPNRWNCPDPGTDIVSPYFVPMLTRYNDWLATAEKTPEYPVPDKKLQERLGDKHCITAAGAIIVRFRDVVEFSAPITPQQYADKSAPALGPDLTGKLRVTGIIEKGNGEKWFLTEKNARLLITGNTVKVW